MSRASLWNESGWAFVNSSMQMKLVKKNGFKGSSIYVDGWHQGLRDIHANL